MNSLKLSVIALLAFLLIVSLHIRFGDATLEGLALGNNVNQLAAGGSSSLLIADTILPGNNSIINYSNGIYGNVGDNASFTFTLGILYNSNCTNQSGVVLNHYKNDATVVSLVYLVAETGESLVMAGMAESVLETGEYVQLMFGAPTGCSLEVLVGSVYSIVRID